MNTALKTQNNTAPLTKDNLIAYANDNPLVIYHDYLDTISDDLAQSLLKGEFDKVYDIMSDIEFDISLHADWDYWEKELARAFGLVCYYEDIPESLRLIIEDYRYIDTASYWRGCFNNYRGNVVATLLKRNGDYIEFPCVTDYNAKENRRLARYLKDACGITGDSDALYGGTVLVALGRVDFYEIFKKQKAPTGLIVSEGDFTVGFCSNGSGTACNDRYLGKPRKFKAEFTIDGMDGRYGVDETFGFVGRVWQNRLELVF